MLRLVASRLQRVALLGEASRFLLHGAKLSRNVQIGLFPILLKDVMLALQSRDLGRHFLAQPLTLYFPSGTDVSNRRCRFLCTRCVVRLQTKQRGQGHDLWELIRSTGSWGEWFRLVRALWLPAGEHAAAWGPAVVDQTKFANVQAVIQPHFATFKPLPIQGRAITAQ